ncbi:Serine-aspartate repeat-containing protein D [Methanosarcinales archaeon]|nr:Serine-aspartate repeat-containing protein D [Methanosarcinales archaeon]
MFKKLGRKSILLLGFLIIAAVIFISVSASGDSATVTGVSSATANGTYTTGQIIAITVTFSEPVNLTGYPEIQLETGTTDQQAIYSSGNGTDTLIFNYTVQAGDASNELDYVATGSLTTNGGTIKNSSGIDAILILPAPGTSGSLGANTDFVIDAVAPTVELISGTTNPTNGLISVTATFNESVTGFDSADILVTNGSVENFGGSGTTYTFDVNPTDGTGITVTIGVPAGSAQDAATNNNTASNTLSYTSDTVSPTVILSSSTSNPTNGLISVTATFNESVTGFIATDVTVTNGTVNNFAGSGTVYTFNVTPTGGANIAVTIDVPAGVTQDGATNSNTASNTLTYTSNTVTPSVTLTSSTPNPTNSLVSVTATFSESVTGFDSSEILVTNGTVNNFAGSGAIYTFNVTPTNGANIAVTIDVPAGVAQDAATNSNTASNTLLYTSDTVSPSVVLSSPTPNPTNGLISVTATFSESVTGFDSTEILVTNGTVGNFAGSGAIYTFNVTPTNGANIAVTIDVPAGAAQDTAGNSNTVSNALSYNSDTVSPTAVLSSSTPNPTNGLISVTATFSESVTGFTSGNVTVTNGTVENFGGSGTSYTFDVNPTDGAGITVMINVPAGSAQDTAGNSNTASNTLTYTSDTVAPSVTEVSSTTANGTYSSGKTIAVTVKFTKSVTVTGTPQIQLETGSTDRQATYSSGSGTNTLTFNYVVQSEDISSDLDYVSTTAFTLNGGTINDSANNAAVLTLAPPGTAGSLGANKAIVIYTQLIISDDFSAPSLNTSLWTFINPRYDANFTMVGTGTKNALLNISIPSGLEHDVWSTNNAPRIMQNVSNIDFEVEVKFQSQVNKMYQSQGVIIQENINKYIRLDIFYDGYDTRKFAATFSNGNPIVITNNIINDPPVFLYMRVKREGDQWTMNYSSDGKNWTTGTAFSYSLNVTSIGPFVGNAGSRYVIPPAHNGLIDYFFNTNNPIIPEDETKLNISGYKLNASDDRGISGWNITLTNDSTTIITSTNNEGFYQFTNLVNGTYTVFEEERSGWKNISVRSQEINVTDQDITNVNFTNRPIVKTYIISGYKINQSDGTGISGWNITLTKGSNLTTRSTNANGYYEFTDIIDGTYTISEELKIGWTNVSQLSRNITVFGQDYTGVNFTNKPISTFKVSGYKLNASDGRGILGWNITIKNDHGQISNFTDENGYYEFANVARGTYTIFEELESEWTNVTPASKEITLDRDISENFTNKPLVIVSDDFSAQELNTGLWTIVDPRNDSDISIIGTGTKNASLSISVPDTSQHEFKIGNYDAPRIMQKASNKDFEIEVKFQSEMTSVNQMEGVIIQQDNNKSIRFNFERDYFSTNIMAITFDNESYNVMSMNSISGSPAPLYMRIKRAGDQWTMNYSTDGMNWTTGAIFSYVLKVTSIGPFVGQSGSGYFPPEYTGKIDYFFNTESIIVPEDPTKFNLTGYKINASDGSGIPGWNITITNGSIQTNKSTGSDGFYEFKELVEGTYTVFEEQRSGWTNVSPVSLEIKGIDQDILSNFTNRPRVYTYKISGYKINASDNTGIKGWNITITNGSATIKTSTNNTGYYEFTDLVNGTYNVTEEEIPEWINITPLTQEITINGKDNLSVNFRNQPRVYTYKLSGYKINANDNTGIQGWNITITNGSATIKTTTNNTGYYEFTDLLNGTYTISEELKPEWLNVTPLSLNRTILGSNVQNVNFMNKPLEIISDDFSDETINTSLWTFINPRNDATLNMAGSGTKDALLNISIPSGLDHDVWSGNRAPRIMQNAPDKDFEIEIKFQSILNKKYQSEGIIVEQDSLNYIRFDFESDGTYTKIFAATFANGAGTPRSMIIINSSSSSPVNLAMRVKRVGNQWSMNYSRDGINWNPGINFVYTLKVTSVGLFVGNAGLPAPAHTGLIDYFFNTNSPKAPEDPSKFSISGYIINASDGRGIPGWNVTAKSDAIQTTVSTNDTGFYNFPYLLNGTYTIFEELQPEWVNLTPLSREVTIDGQGVTNFNFINKPLVIVSDDFSSPSLKSPLWTVINPLNDSTISIIGTGTKNASLSISVPDTSQHEFKDGNLNAPRVMQNASNEDFEIEVKFQSQMTTMNQMEGVIIQQDNNKSIRFNFEQDLLNTNIIALTNDNESFEVKSTTSISGSPVPLYMRIKRAGDQWTMNYSTDGMNWTTGATFSYVLKVTSVGPFVGQSGLPYFPPAYTGQIDYFFNTESIIIPEDPTKFNLTGYKINASDGTGIPGWNITITNGSLQTNKSTGSNGFYEFNDLVEGTYTVFEEQRSGWNNVSPRLWEIKGIDQDILQNFTNRPSVNTYKISGYKINASDNTGIQGWNITVTNGSTPIKTSTDATGYFEFTDLVNGTYNVTEEELPDWINVTPLTQKITIDGRDNLSVNFRNQPRVYTYRLSGYITNANDNTGLQGWNITITNGSTPIKTTTDATGYYEFTDLLNGTYTISEELKPEWLNVTPLSLNRTILGSNVQNVNFMNKPLEIISDDFSDGTFNTSLWTFINPRNDATLAKVGPGTKDALLKISIPSGLDHDIWYGNNAPRIMQNAPDKDFEIEIKFQSVLNKTYQSEGVIIQQDSKNFIRFDFESDVTNLKIFAATFANGKGTPKTMFTINKTSPNPINLTMRVKRIGNQWMMNYSKDGSNWTAGYNFAYILKVTSVGAFIGNAGTPAPAHIGLIDYFFNTNSPLIPEDAPLPGTKFNVSGFKINASDNAGLSGWNITISNSTMLIGSTLTDIDGSYKFTNITKGTYTVSEEIKPEWMNVTPLSREIIVNYDDIYNVNFTNRPIIHTYNLSGYKINASDNTGIAGWNITITNGSTPIRTSTNSTGYYEFKDLVNGTYNVTEEERPGWRNITSLIQEITIDGKDNLSVNFRNQPIIYTYNVSGYKINGDAGTAISGWNISISNGSMTINTSTNNEGFYRFTDLINGTYNVTEENRKGWKNLTDLTRKITISGGDILNQNFINKPLGIVSDDFSNPGQDPSLWTKIDPQNDSSFRIDGIGTSDVLFNITIPAGKAHDVWILNNASRIMQYVNVNDFEVEVMFKSVLNKKYQTQGIIIEQDKDNYIRFDFFSDGTTINAFAANFTNGSASMRVNTPIGAVQSSAIPLYMNIKRVGNEWTQKYSYDRINWTKSVSFNLSLTVTSIGPFIANSGPTPPAFTGLIDYFFNADSPVIPEDALRSNVSGFNIEDNNDNGIWDAGEVGIPDWNISLFNNNTGVEIASMKTDPSGKYAFYNLINGTYKVKEETKAGYFATNSTSFVFTVAGKDIDNINFTNSAPKQLNISGFKIEDKNENGIWDAGEVGLPNWKISLFNNSTGVKIAETTTNFSGQYVFYNLSRDTYRVTEETKTGYIASNSTSLVVSVSNKDISNLNFTNYLTPKYNVSGFMIEDKNENGIWDAGEPGISNWNIYLLNNTTGLMINNTKTDSSGRYIFYNLLRGTYIVTGETNPDYNATNSTSIVINISRNDINNLNFTNYLPQNAPGITTQPVDMNVKLKKTATFNVVATGTKPLSYQWKKNGVNIGTNSPSYTTPPTTMADNGATYSVTVTNSLGTATSNSSKLTVRNIISDDFNVFPLDSSNWTSVNPLGDATITITGAGSGNASLNINLPAGTLHDAWTTNTAPRVMQTADNTDFQIEAKFESVMTSATQIQGIIVEQDSSNYIRFDFIRSSATATKIYAASFASGSATQRINNLITSSNTLYLRINRTANQWKQYYSYDGNNWTLAANFNHVLTVNTVGPYAGNAGNPAPAFNAKIDYFFNSSSPVVPEDNTDHNPPNISLWYGNPQSFGQIGVPQQWVNILGNANDESGVVSMNYSLNGGSARPLTVGPDGMRLQSRGDFNIEINSIDLLCGNNQIEIKAADGAGNVKNESMTVQYSCNNSWPRTYSINWSDVTNIQDVAQIVDGKWTLETNSIRSPIGYDRLVAIGNMTWDDYEITTPITLNSPLITNPMGNFIGFTVRWKGHYDWNSKQPRNGWWPLGALAGYSYVGSNNYRLQIQGNGGSIIADDTSGKKLTVGVPYIFKMRAQTVGLNSIYSLKVWEQGTFEPSEWTISGSGIPGELKNGSVVLMVHNADVSIGNVSIKPGPFDIDTTPPAISNVVSMPDVSSAIIRWNTDESATSNVSYGQSIAYENGSIVDGTLTTSHAITLTGLTAGTQYHYQINSTDTAGNSANTADLSFTTLVTQPGIKSDDFNAPSLNTSLWTVVNPQGDATFAIIGNGTSDSLLSITLPAGLSHSAWLQNTAPRIMQPTSNKDFEIEVKFQSPTSDLQTQGLIVEQDSNNYLRFDFVREATRTRLFAASIIGGSAKIKTDIQINSNNPIFLRVKRTGDQWLQSYSYDGVNWIFAPGFSQALTVTSVGPYFANTGNAVTGLVDYFFDTSSPVVPEDTPLPAIITMQPVNSTVLNGSVATFSVAAGGTPPLSYQWKKNGVDIINATGSSYTTPAVYLPDNGTKFSVVVSNGYGSVTSDEVTLSVIEAGSQWWDAQRNFRIPVTVNATQYERSEKPVEVSVDFTNMLNILGQAGTFDENSLRVVETDSLGVVLSSTVPFQFDKDPDFDSATKATGTIVFIMTGKTQANANRYYQVYFGLTGTPYSTLSVTPQVTLTDNVSDEGQLSYRIGAAGSTYYFQKQAGGLSSLVDASNNDWINFHPTPWTSAGGGYRGIPNVYANGIFHPGWTTGTSSIVSQGPLKIRVRSVTNNGLWESLWDFYPGYATNTIVKAGGTYWWLYEGTPGGSLDQNTDFMVRSDNRKTMLSVRTNDDIPTDEWVYFSDPNVNRSLFVSHHEDDSLIDEYHPMTDTGGSMVVFGFGRTYSQTATISPQSGPQHFTMGLMDGTEFTPGSKTVYSAYKDLSITTGMVEQFDSVSPPIIVTQPADSLVTLGKTATFSVGAIGQLPLSYQWKKNGADIPDAIGASYTTPPTAQSDNGALYSVIVTNDKGSVASNQATLRIGASSNNSQLIIMDVNYTHNNYTMAFSYFGKPNVPDNLVSPINYAGGTIYSRLQVTTKPSTKIVNYQMCMFQDKIVEEKHACTNFVKFNRTGTYYASQSMTSLYQYYNISWDRKLLDQMLVVKDLTGWPVDTRYGFDGNWSGWPNLYLYYPMQVRYTAIIVPPGGGQPVWDNPPVITTQPVNQTVTIGSSATFSVVASGQAPLYYQWQKNGVNINGEHNQTYTTPPTTSTDNGSRYRVIVTNEFGSVPSNEAVLTIPVDLTPPAVIGNSPSGTGVPYTTKISVTFSKAMNKSSAESAFSVIPDISGGTFSWSGNNMTYTPALSLGFNTTYNVTIGTGAKDLYGNNMSSQYQWQFITKEEDLTSPAVIGNSPIGTDVPVTARITVNFSEEMNQSSVISSFSTNPATNGSFSWIGNNMTYTPVLNLSYNTTYSVEIGTGAKDMANNMLPVYSWQFTTIPDTFQPWVISKTPGGTNVPVLSSINVTFSEEMNKSSAESAFSTFPDTSGGTFNWSGNTMKYTPPTSLSYNMVYNVTVGTGAKDVAGNNMAALVTWQFTTASMQPNLVSNGGFESGTTSWSFYTNGAWTYSAAPPGYDGTGSALKIAFTTIGTNMQTYQTGRTLEPNTRYRLSFAGYSTVGHDVTVNLIKDVSPYTNYGLSKTFNLNNSWQSFTTEFTTSGFTGTVKDGRIRFWFVGFAAKGETYYFDDIRLEKVT